MLLNPCISGKLQGNASTAGSQLEYNFVIFPNLYIQLERECECKGDYVDVLGDVHSLSSAHNSVT